MFKQSSAETALDGLRILDLADEKGLSCTKLLADLGADVIKVEKPGRDAARNIGPFWHDIPHPENSLYFAYFNTNKRGITLNIESADGREIFKRLAKGADIIVETYAPGYLASLGLGYPALKELNPGLIMTSITGFGQSGPYKDFKSAEIVAFAMGGLMFMTGDSDMPPVQAGGFQIYYMVGAFAALATLQALYYRNMTKEGQQVDISMQECVASMLETASVSYAYDGKIQSRVGSELPVTAAMGGGAPRGGLNPCKDGYVLMSLTNETAWGSFIKWMVSDGVDVGEFADPIWADRELRSIRREEITSMVRNWLPKHTKVEFSREGQKVGVPIMPLFTLNEVADDPQLKDRNYFVEVDHPQMGSYKYPGAPYKLSVTPWSIRRLSPPIGQHNEEIYGELGFSREDLTTLKGAGVI